MKNKKQKENKPEVKVIDSTEGDSKALEQNPNIVILNKGESERPFFDITEEERKKLFKSYKSASLRNNIIMVVTVAAFIGAFIAITKGQIGQIIGWVLIGVTISALVAYYLVTRNTYPRLSKQYFYDFWKLSNEFLFNQEGFDKCQIDAAEKYQLDDLVADRVYKDSTDIASRNIVRGEYFGKPFVFGEAALYRPGGKKRSREVQFVGRHASFENKYNFEGRYVLNIKKSEKPLDLPNDIEDLEILLQDGDFILYGEKGRNYKKDLGEEVISQLKELKLEGALLNINIAFWKGKTVCYLSYDDVIVAIPFQSEINSEAYEFEKRDIEHVFAILAK